MYGNIFDLLTCMSRTLLLLVTIAHAAQPEFICMIVNYRLYTCGESTGMFEAKIEESKMPAKYFLLLSIFLIT